MVLINTNNRNLASTCTRVERLLRMSVPTRSQPHATLIQF